MDHSRQREYEILRDLSPAKKLAVMSSLIRQAYALKTAWVRASYPDLPEGAVQEKVRALVSGGGRP